MPGASAILESSDCAKVRVTKGFLRFRVSSAVGRYGSIWARELGGKLNAGFGSDIVEIVEPAWALKLRLHGVEW